MKVEERQKKISEFLQEREFASLEELALHVLASVSTVRRDLTELEATGILRRTHGGARSLNPQAEEFVFLWRETIQQPEKDAIGRACANLIQPGETVIIDSGTTVYHAARHLAPHVNHVITNSLPVANLFGSNPRIQVIITGGEIYPRLGVFVGQLAVDAISKLHADVAIMGGGGITLEGITNSDTLLIDIQKGMIAAAGKVIFCLDHTKFGRRSVAQLCDISSIDIVITDSKAPPDLVNALRNRGVEVIMASVLETPTGPTQQLPTAVPSPAPASATKAPATSEPRRLKPSRPQAQPRSSRATPPTSPPEPDASSGESSDRMGWD